MKEKFKIVDRHLFEIVKKGGIAFLFYGLNLVLVYLIALFISKSYGADAYGRYAIIKSLIQIFIIIATLGLNTLAIKFSSDAKFYERGIYKSDYLQKSYYIIFISSALISSFIYFFRKEISLHVFKDIALENYFIIFPILLISSVFLNYNSNLFKGQQKVLLFSIVSSFLNNFLLLISAFFIFHWVTSEEFFLINIFWISFVVAVLVSLFYTFPIKYNSEIDKVSYRKLFSLSLPMMLSSSMIYITLSTDILMLGFFETSDKVGIYRIVAQIASLNTLFVIVFGTVVGPKLSQLYAENKKQKFKETILKSSKLIFYITLPVLVVILVFSKSILMYFGKEYSIGFNALIVLCISQFFVAISGFVDYILNMTGHQKIFSRITLTSAILNVVLNVLLIPIYGIIGAAIATSFSIILTNIMSIIFIKKRLKVLSIYLPFIKNS